MCRRAGCTLVVGRTSEQILAVHGPQIQICEEWKGSEGGKRERERGRERDREKRQGREVGESEVGQGGGCREPRVEMKRTE
jgi:hypothetical protein